MVEKKNEDAVYQTRGVTKASKQVKRRLLGEIAKTLGATGLEKEQHKKSTIRKGRKNLKGSQGPSGYILGKWFYRLCRDLWQFFQKVLAGFLGEGLPKNHGSS